MRLSRWQRFKDWLMPERAYQRRLRERERGARWLRRMHELTQGAPVDLGVITRERGWEMPSETVDLLRRAGTWE